MFLLKEINKTLNQNNLRESKYGEDNRGSMINHEKEEYSTLSSSELAQLVEMVAEYMNNEGYSPSDLNYAMDFAYDLVSDIPGLEDEYAAEQAVAKIINQYKQFNQ